MNEPGPLESAMGALGRIPSGLFVLTFRHGEQETGMLASWVQQCSFDPPQVVAAIRQGRYVLNWLANGATFVVNILAEGERGLIRHFGKGFEEGTSAFDGLEVNQGVLAQAHASLECRVAAMHDVGDHVLVVGQVAGGAVISDGKPAVHVRKTGRHY